MRRTCLLLLAGLALAAAPRAEAGTSYNFSVLYFGGGLASQAPGSDTIVGTTLFDDDTFTWDIKAQGGAWQVLADTFSFPLMAFGVQEAGLRVGDFTLTLKNAGVDVLTTSEVGAEQRYVHVGTNTIFLTQGLVFDEMFLSYHLITAVTDDPNVPVTPIGSTISGLLPIFGAPEFTSPGSVVYGAAVPEPTSMALMLVGLCGLGLARRRGRTTS
ncbi:PEP-CTERM sorting domain-containing protein [Paludisphaera mucosa]|uniref:PEP-CTERM sorting domain-containing protein n=1 Tax=Paludisphaera mucosa TaxID=3030827 RepID=A0ABT6F427_9BACT|nr:PEP-CTERM sorting domain-containing protein [Paludisphaera mucosa]MDG3002343.1 PEP-CTERM sorting domain-containing protein [Paludisphaera mucosa]